jgi:hypothetical protein
VNTAEAVTPGKDLLSVTVIDSTDLLIRLEYIERTVFGQTLTVTHPTLPPFDPGPHKCIGAPVAADVATSARAAAAALEPLIKEQEANLQMLRRWAQISATVAEDPAALTDALRIELQLAYHNKILDFDVAEAVGLITGDMLADSTGQTYLAEYGFVQGRVEPGETHAEDILARETCADCRANMEEMFRRDTATGHWPPANASK